VLRRGGESRLTKRPAEAELDGKVMEQQEYEARERHSDLIFISTEHAPSEEKLLGPTTRYVLSKRPCRVIVESENAVNGEHSAVYSDALKGADEPSPNGVGEPIAVG
jgi:hypothetical protein